MALLDINNADNIAENEETVYSFDEQIHPEGEYPDAEIVDAREVKGYIIVDISTIDGMISKFYKREIIDGKPKIDPFMKYLVSAAGLSLNRFTLTELIGKTVKITVSHTPDRDTGEPRANISKIEKA